MSELFSLIAACLLDQFVTRCVVGCESFGFLSSRVNLLV